MADFFNRRGGQNDDYDMREGNNFDRRYGSDRGGEFYDDRRQTSARSNRNTRATDERLNRALPPIEPYGRQPRQFQPVNGAAYPQQGAVPHIAQQMQPAGEMPVQQVFSMQNVVLFSPKSYSDVQTLIDHLRKREPAIVDFAGVADDSGQRILDFLSGAIYALGGSMQRISEAIFLLTPSGITISAGGDIAKTIEDKRNRH